MKRMHCDRLSRKSVVVLHIFAIARVETGADNIFALPLTSAAIATSKQDRSWQRGFPLSVTCGNAPGAS